MINKRILLSTIYLFIIIFSGPYHAMADIDIGNPDPDLWDKIQQKAKEKDLSRQRIGYFSLGKETLQFRDALDPNDKGSNDEFELMENPKGEHFLVSKKVLIDSNDIYGILIEKTGYGSNKEYTITLHLKHESWDKFYEVTSRPIKKHLAIIRGNTLLIAPVVQEAITSSVMIASDFNGSDIDKFKTGLILMDQAYLDTWNKRTIKWLESKIKRNPDDVKMLFWLAREYFNGNPRNCEKALPLFEKGLMSDSSQVMYVYSAHDCYKSLKQYDGAIKIYERILPMLKDKLDEMAIRQMMIEIYGLKGDMQKMINTAETNLKIMKEMPLPSFDFLPAGPSKEKFIEKMREKIEQAIKEQEEAIQKAKLKFDQNKKLNQ